MARPLMKYMDVDVIAFLKEQMEHNTKHYQTDFEIDKKAIARYVDSERKEDKTLLWLSRSHGTQLMREHEVFIKGTADHQTWRYFAEQDNASIVAFALELTGRKDGLIRGNLYELDHSAHAALVVAKSVEPLDMEKIFEDGFSLRVEPDRSSVGYYEALVETHGPIVDSYTAPRDKEEHAQLLFQQKQIRDHMPKTALSGPQKLFFQFDEEITVFDDYSKLEGYVWATDDLVARLKAQEPPLGEGQFMENINFYPIYDAEHEKVTMEGHYWLVDAQSETSKEFILPLSPDEQKTLLHGFHNYCRSKGMGNCLDYLNQVRAEEGLGKLPRKSLDSRIADADRKAAQGIADTPDIHRHSMRELG